MTNEFDAPEVPLDEAVAALRGLLRDFRFAEPADESRAIAAILAPMLRLGPWQAAKVVFPIFALEADESQAGKGMFVELVSTIYNEAAGKVARARGGVGSFDEAFGKTLLRGRPLVLLDNLRGRLDSQMLESFMTARGVMHARGLRADGEVDSRRFVIYATSNGMETTEDTANRLFMVRIRKQPWNYAWHAWPEGSLVRHAEVRKSYYLGCVCAVLRHWIVEGMPAIPCQHDMREFAGAMNWIAQGPFALPALVEGHRDVQQRVMRPGLTLLREIGLRTGLPEATYAAADIIQRALDYDIAIPNWDGNGARDEESEKRLLMHVGRLLGSCFKDSNSVVIDGIEITRIEEQQAREDGNGSFTKKSYRFRRSPG